MESGTWTEETRKEDPVETFEGIRLEESLPFVFRQLPLINVDKRRRKSLFSLQK